MVSVGNFLLPLVFVARSGSWGKEGKRKSTSWCMNWLPVLADCCWHLLSPVMSLLIHLSFHPAGDSHRHPPAEQRQRGGGAAVPRAHDRGGQGQSGRGKEERRAVSGSLCCSLQTIHLAWRCCATPVCCPFVCPSSPSLSFLSPIDSQPLLSQANHPDGVEHGCLGGLSRKYPVPLHPLRARLTASLQS